MSMLVLVLSGCGGAPSYAGWTEARAQVATGGERAANALALGALVFVDERASEPFAVLDADGRLHRRDCERVIAQDGSVRDAASEALVLQVTMAWEGDAHVVDADGALRFHVVDDRLMRADRTGAAAFDGDVMRFEGSGGIALRVEGADDAALRRTALLVVAALSMCE
ncbi:hypothetical protein DB32_006822 [Sandaracinus amylolyticus]|uniref:Uncharacterized protein n=1 Tax=Sandaracinus amylolyticus TaxID=927083 RepID=A0A0F6W7W5_9BACT|nr:hypothetical protein DB32_006822 [Sandaracinus amylolyticus]